MRAKDFLLSSTSSLFEVKMSPTNLTKLASKIDAKVGIEFEMIIPDVYVRDEDDYPENDMSENRRVSSISDIIDFFGEGDENTGYELSKLEDALRDDYDSKLENITKDKWNKDGEEYFKIWVRENVPDYEVANRLEIEYEDEDKIELTKEQWDEFTKEEWLDETYNHDKAYEEFKENLIDHEIEEDDVLKEMGIEWMEDVYDSYDIAWPYKEWMGDDPDYVFSQFADDLKNYVNYDVEYSTGYHSIYKSDDSYMIEPDSSISPAGVGAGIEVVSPPLPLEEAIQEMENVVSWANDNNAHTNASTGLHINISVPGYDTDKLDFVKLALLSGDKYVLEQFDRVANTFAVSALDRINEFSTDTDRELFFRTLKGKINNITSNILHPAATDKYTSINVKNNRIEFRGPGGDWLNKNTGEIISTIHRFIVALDAALDPTKYQEEYLKKLTKSFSPKKGSIEELFVKYTSGNLTKEGLKQELQNLRTDNNKRKLLDKGIVIIPELEVKLGDWIIEQTNGNNKFTRLFLKKTKDVDTPEKALSVISEAGSNKFDMNRIEDIQVTEFQGTDRYSIYERGYPFVSGTNVYATTPNWAVEKANIDGDIELEAALSSDLDYRKTNAQLVNRSQQIYAIVSLGGTGTYTVVISQCLLSGRTPENAKARARLWFGTKFDSFAYVIEAYPIEEYTRENPNNDPNKLKVYSVSGSEDWNNYDIVATSKKQAAEVMMHLNGGSTENMGTLLIYELENMSAIEVDSYLNSQNSKLSQRAGYTDNYLDVSKGIVSDNSEPDDNDSEGDLGEYLVKVKGVTSGGIVVRANSKENAFEKAYERYSIPAWQELEAFRQDYS